MTKTKVAMVASEIRKEFKAAFPTIKFSVRSSNYSMGSSIRVEWTDLPSVEAVEAITSKYSNVRYCEVTGEILSGGNMFINEEQELSPEFRALVESQMEEHEKDSLYWRRSAMNRIMNKMWEEQQAPKQAEQAQEESTQSNVVAGEAVLTINEERNGIEITFNSKPSANVIGALKEKGFKWSSFGGKWWAKNTADRLRFATMLVEAYNSIMQEEPMTDDAEETEQVTEVVQESITVNAEPSYKYHDVHFKAWNYSVEDITSLLDVTSINYYEYGEKFICTGLTIEQVKQIEFINEKNGATIYYDKQYNELLVQSPSEPITAAEQSSGKITVSRIIFEWSESAQVEDGHIVYTFAEADVIIRKIAQYAPDNGAYDKTAFTIVYADGQTYKGRYDVTHNDLFQGSLSRHVTDFVEHSAGIKKPSRMSVEDWNNMIQSTKADWLEFYEKYALTDVTPDPEPIKTYKPNNNNVADFATFAAKKRNNSKPNTVPAHNSGMTAEQKVKYEILKNFFPADMLEQGLQNFTVDELFRITAELSEIYKNTQ